MRWMDNTSGIMDWQPRTMERNRGERKRRWRDDIIVYMQRQHGQELQEQEMNDIYMRRRATLDEHSL